MKSINKILHMLFALSFVSTAWAMEQRYTYYENDGIFIYYETEEEETYRELLPERFSMPEELLVYVFVSDFYKMDANTKPYKEAAIFILGENEGSEIWHCIFMPVTSHESRIAGILNLGLPKTMGDISITRSTNYFSANVLTEAGHTMELKLDTNEYQLSHRESRSINSLSTLPKVNQLNGELIQMGRSSKRGVLQLSRFLGDRLVLKAGSGDCR